VEHDTLIDYQPDGFKKVKKRDCMNSRLIERAYLSEETGKSRLVIEDGALLDWSVQHGITPKVAQLEALTAGIIPLRYLRNFSALDLPEQVKICRSSVLICGCGGLGGVLINLLVRLGVGFLRVVDGDAFAPSNLNRQWLCDTQRLSQPKARVAQQQVRAINPLVEVEAFPELLDETNAHELLQGMDLVLDALDNLPGRFLLADSARRLGSPFIHGAATGWWGQVSTFMPDSPLDLTAVYGTRKVRDAAEIALGVLGPAPSLIGSLQAFEAIRLLSGRKPAYVNRLLFFDGESGVMELIPL
jgi:molybdopterin-synthase adenylyltransferase